MESSSIDGYLEIPLNVSFRWRVIGDVNPASEYRKTVCFIDKAINIPP
jgi:hypothetical protein